MSEHWTIKRGLVVMGCVVDVSGVMGSIKRGDRKKERKKEIKKERKKKKRKKEIKSTGIPNEEDFCQK